MPTLASCYIALVGVNFAQEHQERYPDKSDVGAGRCPNYRYIVEIENENERAFYQHKTNPAPFIRKFYLTLQFYTVKLEYDFKNYQSSLQKK